MIAGENTEAAGVDRQRFVQPELRRKIRDRAVKIREGALCPGVVSFQVGLEVSHHAVVVLYEYRVLGRAVQVGCLLEQSNRVVLRTLPEFRVEAGEKPLSGWAPGPEEVVREVWESFQPGRDIDVHAKGFLSFGSSHGVWRTFTAAILSRVRVRQRIRTPNEEASCGALMRRVTFVVDKCVFGWSLAPITDFMSKTREDVYVRKPRMHFTGDVGEGPSTIRKTHSEALWKGASDADI